VTLLALAFYGNQLGVYFSQESFLAHSLVFHLSAARGDKEEYVPGSVAMSDLLDTIRKLEAVFQNEFIPQIGHKMDESALRELLHYGEVFGIVAEDAGQVHLVNSRKAEKSVHFLQELL